MNKKKLFPEKVEMNEKIVIYQPYEAEQILLAENASCLAVKTYLKMLSRDFVVRSCQNAGLFWFFLPKMFLHS